MEVLAGCQSVWKRSQPKSRRDFNKNRNSSDKNRNVGSSVCSGFLLARQSNWDKSARGEQVQYASRIQPRPILRELCWRSSQHASFLAILPPVSLPSVSAKIQSD